MRHGLCGAVNNVPVVSNILTKISFFPVFAKFIRTNRHISTCRAFESSLRFLPSAILDVQITIFPTEAQIREGREVNFDCRARTADNSVYPPTRYSFWLSKSRDVAEISITHDDFVLKVSEFKSATFLEEPFIRNGSICIPQFKFDFL